MARKSIQELAAQAASDIADNTTYQVSPADVRNWMLDLLHAIHPAYGLLTLEGPVTRTVNIAPHTVVWATAQDSDSTDTASDFTAGTITRSERGACQISFNADVECATNRFVTFTLMKDGVATPWRVSANGAGAANPVACSLVAMDYADPAAVYSIQVSAEADGASVTFSNMVFLLSIVPVNSFI